MTDDEKVLCVSRLSLEAAVVAGDARAQLDWLLSQKHYRWRRSENDDGPPVEEDSRWKQLIPYIVCVNDKGQILAYNRGWKGGEDRLKGRWAIGFGGHINNQDADWMAGVWREIREELFGADSVAYGYTAEQAPGSQLLYGPIGLIDDNSDPVGQHHTGVVYVLRADEVTPKENPEYEWHDMEFMEAWSRAERTTLESWARLALPMVRAWMEAN